MKLPFCKKKKERARFLVFYKGHNLRPSNISNNVAMLWILARRWNPIGTVWSFCRREIPGTAVNARYKVRPTEPESRKSKETHVQIHGFFATGRP